MTDTDIEILQENIINKLINMNNSYTKISREDKMARVIDLIIYWLEIEQNKRGLR